MRRTDTAEEVEALRRALATRASAGWSLREGPRALAGLGPEALELAGRPGSVVLRATDGARLWRVVGWEERGGELRLQVLGAFGRTGATLRVARDGEGPLAWGPDWFEEALRRALEATWGEPLLARRGDRLLGRARGPGGEYRTVVGVPPDAGRAVDDALAAGLVARDRYERATGRPAELLVFSAPPALRALAERLAWLSPRAAVRLLDVTAVGVAEVRPHDQGTLYDGVLDGGGALWPRPVLPPDPLVERMLAVAPDCLRRSRRPRSSVDRILLRGLECARARGGAATFGPPGAAERLSEEAWPRFAAYVAELASLRSPAPPDRSHPAYRAQPERWLAALLRDDVRIVDPGLDPSTVHEQVPAYRAETRDLIDLLAVTRAGRLAVVEIKAGDDRALPLQGLNYWARVRWHHARGDIERRGYFPGRALDPRPPLLFLVAPLFRIHPSVRVVTDLLSPEVEVTVVGLNSDWRSRPRALARWRRSEIRGEQGSGIGP